jgi:hypothetical protein
LPDGLVTASGKTSADRPLTVQLSIMLMPTSSEQPGSKIDVRAWPQFFASPDAGFALYVVDESTKPPKVVLVTKEDGQPLLLRDNNGAAKFKRAQQLWHDIFTSQGTCDARAMFTVLKSVSKLSSAALDVQKSGDEIKAQLNIDGRKFILDRSIHPDAHQIATVLKRLSVEEIAQAIGLRLVRIAGQGLSIPPTFDRGNPNFQEAMQLLARAERPLDPRLALSYSNNPWEALLATHPAGDKFGLVYDLAHDSINVPRGEGASDFGAQTALNWMNPSPSHASAADLTAQALVPPLPRDTSIFSDIAQGKSSFLRLMTDRNAIGSFRNTVKAFDAAWAARSGPNDKWCNIGDPEIIVRRKFNAIMTFPTLAKFVCLIADVEFKASLLTNLIKKNAPIDGSVADQYFGSLIAIPVDKDSPAVAAANIDLNTVTRTAFMLQEAVGNEPPKFVVPLADQRVSFEEPQPTKLAAAYPFADGVVKLTSPRYQLETIDIAAGVNAGRVQATAIETQKRNGTWSAKMVVKPPELRTRGIALLDTQAATQAMMDMAFWPSLLPTAAPADNVPKSILPPLCLSDLVVGYRLDVQRTKAGSMSALKWRTLMAREVIFPDIYEAMFDREPPKGRFAAVKPAFGNRFRERDEGVIRSMLKTQQNGIGANYTLSPVTSQNIVTWNGNSLGLSALDIKTTDKPDIAVSVWRDLGIAIEYRYALDDDRKPHVLRVGDGYEFGMRYVLPNGSSISLAEATKKYTKTDKNPMPLTLGLSRFQRSEEIPAPQICVPSDDPVVAPIVGAQSQGDQSDLIILVKDTPGQKGRDNIRRFLIPPRAGFDYVEQYGVFDNVKEPQPAGVLRNFDISAVAPFGVAANGKRLAKTSQNVHVRADVAPEPKTAPSGLVLKYKPNVRRSEPYYADPIARNIGVTFIRNGGPADEFEVLPPPLAFWERNSTLGSRAAAPVELLFRRWTDADAGGRFGVVQKVFFKERSVQTPERIDQLTIDVAPAEDVEVVVWAYPDMPIALRSHKLLFKALAYLAGFNFKRADVLLIGSKLYDLLESLKSAHNAMNDTRGSDDTDEIWRLVVGMVPLLGFNMLQRIRVVHAVEKPLTAPAFQRKGVLPDSDLAFNIIRLPPATVGLPPENPSSWTSVVKSGSDLSSEPSREGGTIGFVTGRISVNRASSGTLICEANWWNSGESDSVILDDKSQRWVLNPKLQTASPALFQIPQLVRDPGENLSRNDVDLTTDEFGRVRALNFTFPDTKARKLALRLVAKSRFAEYFSQKSGSQNNDTRFQTESGMPHIGPSRGQMLGHNEFWLKATERPKKPEVTKVVWLLPEDVVRSDASRIIVTKRVAVRIYLDRYWHDSGDGELLALVCWPPNLVDEKIELLNATETTGHRLDPGEAARADKLRQMSLCDLTASASPFVSQYVTRWGVDPTTISGDLPAMIGPEHFGGYCRKMPNVPLPRLEPKKKIPQMAGGRVGDSTFADITESVAIIAYQPSFDPKEGLWYCDIEFDPGPAHAPFVRFGLARYQPNAIAGKELSVPHALDAMQIPPRRTVDITITDNKKIDARVTGVGYSKRSLEYKDYPDTEQADRYQNLTDVPLQRFAIMRALPLPDSKILSGPVVVFDSIGKPLEINFIQPSESNGQLQWTASFDLPEPIDTGKYSLIIEEIDLYTSDADTRPKHADPAIGHLVSVPGKFACKVELHSP